MYNIPPIIDPVEYLETMWNCVRARVRVAEPAQPARAVRAHRAHAPLSAVPRALPPALHGQHAHQEGPSKTTQASHARSAPAARVLAYRAGPRAGAQRGAAGRHPGAAGRARRPARRLREPATLAARVLQELSVALQGDILELQAAPSVYS